MPKGFIQDPLEVKLLILYILARVVEPIDLSTLTDLALCDEGVDYFQLTQALSDLRETGHVELTEGRYAITPKGRTNGAAVESGVPYSVRVKCDRSTGELNAILRRNSMVRASLAPRPEGGHTVTLSLSDEEGVVLRLEMLAYSEEQGKRLMANFKEHAEQIYNAVLSDLLADYDDSAPGED